jgi:hypothetical protein
MACICVKEEIFMMQFSDLKEISLMKISEDKWSIISLRQNKEVSYMKMRG